MRGGLLYQLRRSNRCFIEFQIQYFSTEPPKYNRAMRKITGEVVGCIDRERDECTRNRKRRVEKLVWK